MLMLDDYEPLVSERPPFFSFESCERSGRGFGSALGLRSWIQGFG